MEALQPWKDFSYEDIIRPLGVTPHLEKNGITIVIEDTLVERIINEKDIVCCKGIVATSACEQHIAEDFHAVHFMLMMKKNSKSDLYHIALLLT